MAVLSGLVGPIRKNCLFPVTRPTLFYMPDPSYFATKKNQTFPVTRPTLLNTCDPTVFFVFYQLKCLLKRWNLKPGRLEKVWHFVYDGQTHWKSRIAWSRWQASRDLSSHGCDPDAKWWGKSNDKKLLSGPSTSTTVSDLTVVTGAIDINTHIFSSDVCRKISKQK